MSLQKSSSLSRSGIGVWVILFTLLFLGVNMVALVLNETMLVSLLPVFLLFVYLYFFAVDKLFLIIAAAIPLAVNLSDFDSQIAVTLPTEPLLAGLLLLFLLKSLFEPQKWKPFQQNPITIAFLIYFAWLFFAALASQMPLVSWKYFVAHLWLIVPLYFFGTRVFFLKPNSQRAFVLLQVAALVVVVLYALIRHASYGFGDQESQWVMQPFYKDHAIYGSAIALFLPVLILLLFDKKYSLTARFFMLLALAVLLIGLTMSFSRAAWLGFFVAFGLGLVVQFRIKLKYLFISFFGLVLLVLIFQNQIIQRLEKNKQDSSEDVVKNIESMSNISTDASNLERLNRWNCALRMSADHPVFGTGPGTYQFLYGPYQLSRDLTIISTNAGTLGNAHSEFLGAMAETGILGMMTVIFLVITIFVYGFNTYVALQKVNKVQARFVLGILLGLLTYFVHAFLNNFLDSDKIAVPVWGFVAIIVANGLQLKANKERNAELNEMPSKSNPE
jgi:O-antigen ligase